MLDGGHSNRGGVDVTTLYKFLHRPAAFGSKLFVVPGDGGSAVGIDINNGGQVNRFPTLFELMKNARMVTPKRARAYDCDVDRGIACQGMAAAYFAGFFRIDICPA